MHTYMYIIYIHILYIYIYKQLHIHIPTNIHTYYIHNTIYIYVGDWKAKDRYIYIEYDSSTNDTLLCYAKSQKEEDKSHGKKISMGYISNLKVCVCLYRYRCVCVFVCVCLYFIVYDIYSMLLVYTYIK